MGTPGEGRHIVILGGGDILQLRDSPLSQPLLWMQSALMDSSGMEESDAEGEVGTR